MRAQIAIFIVITLLSPVVTYAQDPVRWEAVGKKTTGNGYLVTVRGAVAKGWHVYAATDTAAGLEPVTLHFDSENIVPDYNRGETAFDGLNSLIPLDFKDPLFDNKYMKVYGSSIHLEQRLIINGHIPATLTIFIKGFASDNTTFLPFEVTKSIAIEGGSVADVQNIKLASVDLKNPVSTCGDVQNTDKGLLAIFFLGFGGGLLALLTPCVFPMIPVTVSFFTGLGKPAVPKLRIAGTKTKRSKSGITNGILYGLSIFFIYLFASIPFHLIGNINPQVFNTISTSAGVNIFFFVIFILFALSFFGVFHIKLPAAIANSTGKKGGIFFMALTLAVVSFSCTGPILGSLLVGSLSSEGGAWQLTSGMAGFGIALALPFALFAMFPHWLRTLPKSGGWMDVVKKSLAFVELALAIKFLSNADLVKHWGILKREVFIGLWVVISLALSFYLFGGFKKNDSLNNGLFGYAPPKNNNRNLAGVIVLLFALYLIPGITNTSYANLKLLSGFPPPLSYSIYGKENIKGKGLEPMFVNDYEKALLLAKQLNKPLLIDFTGWACVNCRKMEEQVWTKPSIVSLIKDSFILVSLYVDDRRKLPMDQRFKTAGAKWAAFQAENFGQVTQPLYVILSPGEILLNNPVGYTPGQNKYEQWLKCGLDANSNSPK